MSTIIKNKNILVEVMHQLYIVSLEFISRFHAAVSGLAAWNAQSTSQNFPKKEWEECVTSMIIA